MKYLVALSIFFSSLSYAGGWSQIAVPTRVDMVGSLGFMVYGDFGNGGECTITDRFYVTSNHPEYKELYSTVLAAYMGGKKIQVYIHECNSVTWYAVATTTFNTLTSSGVLTIRNE